MSSGIVSGLLVVHLRWQLECHCLVVTEEDFFVGFEALALGHLMISIPINLQVIAATSAYFALGCSVLLQNIQVVFETWRHYLVLSFIHGIIIFILFLFFILRIVTF